jgi:hypothetical protein
MHVDQAECVDNYLLRSFYKSLVLYRCIQNCSLTWPPREFLTSHHSSNFTV